jgi:DNA-binding response OmpR family regulator
MAQKILVVDDEQDICEILEFNLANEGFDITCAYSGEEALKKITPEHSLILLDVMMGGMSGYKMAEKLRREGNLIPIIFLTAKDTENDMLTGFSVGGDDYISKPFSIKEVVARVKVVLRRQKYSELPSNNEKKHKFVFGDITIDIETKEVHIADTKIVLTKTEFEILVLLASNPKRIFNREDIIDRLWKDSPYITERTVDVHITRLRKKLGERAGLISSRSGYGYRFNTPNNENEL